MAVCCPEGSLGPAPFVETETRGEIITVSAKKEGSKRPPMPFYCVGPSSPKRIVLLFGDIYGLESGNHKVFCDVLQKRLGDDTAVYLADVFRGCPTVGGWGILPMFLAHFLVIPSLIFDVKTRFTEDKVEADITDIILPYCIEEKKCANVSMLGFCFGAWIAARALGLDRVKSGLEKCCGIGMHPSLQIETLHSKKEVDMLRKIQVPVLLLPASNDHYNLASEEAKVLAETRKVPLDQVVVEFPDMVHGFVMRGDSKDEKTARDQEKALTLIVQFINDHCAT